MFFPCFSFYIIQLFVWLFSFFVALWVDMNKQISLSKMFCYVFVVVVWVFRWKIHHKFWLLFFLFLFLFYVKKKLCCVFLCVCVCFKKMWKNLKQFLLFFCCILMMLHSFLYMFVDDAGDAWWCWWLQRLMLEQQQQQNSISKFIAFSLGVCGVIVMCWNIYIYAYNLCIYVDDHIMFLCSSFHVTQHKYIGLDLSFCSALLLSNNFLAFFSLTQNQESSKKQRRVFHIFFHFVF